MTTKEQILKCFKDIDHAYNDCTRYDTLKCMLDELQEPCEDCIRRQAVLDLLVKYDNDMGFDVYSEIFDNIDKLPPVNPKQSWIPVSERLPEVDGKYLTYIVNEHERSLKYIMTCELIWNSISDNHWFPDDECASNNVVAWMPLPEPYKQESEKKK